MIEFIKHLDRVLNNIHCNDDLNRFIKFIGGKILDRKAEINHAGTKSKPKSKADNEA
jgi:hypothetical protein